MCIRDRYKEVWIGLGGTQSAVDATEVSPEEYCTYTTEETEKLEVMPVSYTHLLDTARLVGRKYRKRSEDDFLPGNRNGLPCSCLLYTSKVPGI